jgi:hypothetical protein
VRIVDVGVGLHRKFILGTHMEPDQEVSTKYTDYTKYTKDFVEFPILRYSELNRSCI